MGTLSGTTIRLDEPLLLSRLPVTNGQFDLFIQGHGYENQKYWSEAGWRWCKEHGIHEPAYRQSAKWNCPNQPVVGVSFWEAEAFCKWAGGRLPSETEWEAAARGPKHHKYPWEGEWENGICNSREAGLESTSPVGIFPRSRSQPFGLEDMAGNVWEWCSDPFEPGDKEGPDASRVLRGGSWSDGAWVCRAAIRSRFHPVYRYYDVGFRVVVSRQDSL